MMAVIKVLAALVVLGVLGATVWLVDQVRNEATVPQLDTAVPEEGTVLTVSPGELAFERAVELLATAEYEQAKEKLEFVVGVYPGTQSADEARRILGELNLDKLLSTDEMEGKQVHTVVRGDSFSLIARKYETTLDCIMHMNGLLRQDRLYPGDELVVMPLNFNVKIDVPRKRLSLMSEGRFLKAYPLLDARIKPGSKGTIRTSVRQKTGLINGSSVPPMHSSYRNASKSLSLSAGGLQIREVAEVDEEDPGNGFFLKEAEMEELALLLRVGNEVEVRFTND